MLTFSLGLEKSGDPARGLTDIDAPLDLESYVIDGSSLLYEAGYRLTVGGFGDERWRVDEWDLSSLVLQIPSVLAALSAGEGHAELDFFEQGLQRRIEIDIRGQSLVLNCRSATDWQPSPARIEMPRSELAHLSVVVLRKFVEGLSTIAGDWTVPPTMERWLSGAED